MARDSFRGRLGTNTLPENENVKSDNSHVLLEDLRSVYFEERKQEYVYLWPGKFLLSV